MHDYGKQLRRMEFPLSSEHREILLTALLEEIAKIEGVNTILSPTGMQRITDPSGDQIQLRNQGTIIGERTLQVDIFLEVQLEFPSGKVGVAVQEAAGKLVNKCLPPDVRYVINVHVLRIAS